MMRGNSVDQMNEGNYKAEKDKGRDSFSESLEGSRPPDTN